MQSADRPLPFLALPKTNPASRQAWRICSQGRSAAAVDGIVVGAAEDDVAEDDVAGADVVVVGSGAAADGFAIAGERAALVASRLDRVLLAARGPESVFAGCGVAAGVGAALGTLAAARSEAFFVELSGTSFAAVGGAGAAGLAASSVAGGVATTVVGAEADRLAAPAKWMAAAIPPTASTAKNTAATIQGVREDCFPVSCDGAEVSATVGALTPAEVLTVLTAREWPELASRCRRFRSARRSLAVW